MKIRKASYSDIETIDNIYIQARKYMRENGNMLQWNGGYPDRQVISSDIDQGNSYVVTDDEDKIIAAFAFIKGPDPTYNTIYKGKWTNNEDYHVIHRIAVSVHKKGVASFIFDECLKKCRNLRVDTHRDNIPMQNSLMKNGFTYCGIIYLLSGDERLAYMKKGLCG